jgi:hypothetical protein
MTTPEKNVLTALGDAFNQFDALSRESAHPRDRDEFAFHVHALQRIVMARLAVRTDPEFFNHD